MRKFELRAQHPPLVSPLFGVLADRILTTTGISHASTLDAKVVSEIACFSLQRRQVFHFRRNKTRFNLFLFYHLRGPKTCRQRERRRWRRGVDFLNRDCTPGPGERWGISRNSMPDLSVSVAMRNRQILTNPDHFWVVTDDHGVVFLDQDRPVPLPFGKSCGEHRRA